VLAAAGAIGISLWATGVCNTHLEWLNVEWHNWAWYLLAGAAALLLIDLIFEDVVGAWVRRRSGAEK
jgi:hypothetical protein